MASSVAVSYTHLDVYKRQVETLKGLVRSMTGSNSASKHNKVGITDTAYTNNKMNMTKL